MVSVCTRLVFLACASLALSVALLPAPGLIRLPITKRPHPSHKHAREVTARATVGEATAVNQGVDYVTTVKIGTSTVTLLVDTGSSVSWASHSFYAPGSTATNTSTSFSQQYLDGSKVGGSFFTDNWTLGGLTISKQEFGLASTVTGPSATAADGIIAFGPQGGQIGVPPNIIDNLLSQKLIPSGVLGVSFEPLTGTVFQANGELTLGGTDSTKFTGAITFTPTTSATTWTISVTSITFGSTNLGNSVSTLVDTGNTFISLPSAVYTAFLSASKGKTDPSSFVKFTTAPTANLSFLIGGRSFTLTPQQYLVSTTQYSVLGLASGSFYAWIGNGGTFSILGQKFIEHYYTVIDSGNHRVGFATPA